MTTNHFLFDKSLYLKQRVAPFFQNPDENGKLKTSLILKPETKQAVPKAVVDSNSSQVVLHRTLIAKMVKKKGPDLILNIRQIKKDGETTVDQTTRPSYSRLNQDSKPIVNEKLRTLVSGPNQSNFRIASEYLQIHGLAQNRESNRSLRKSLNEIDGVMGMRYYKTPIPEKDESKPKLNTQHLSEVIQNEDIDGLEKNLLSPVFNPKFQRKSVVCKSLLIEPKREVNEGANSLGEDSSDILGNSTTSIVEHLHEEEAVSSKPKLVIRSLDDLKSRTLFNRASHDPEQPKEDQLDLINVTRKRNGDRTLGIRKSMNILPNDSRLNSKEKTPSLENDVNGWECMKVKQATSEKINWKYPRETNIGAITKSFVEKPRVTIKTYSKNKLKSKKKLNLQHFDAKILKLCRANRTIEERILSPLDESMSSETTFTEYVEAIKSENGLRGL